jgi:hypothetical protein
MIGGGLFTSAFGNLENLHYRLWIVGKKTMNRRTRHGLLIIMKTHLK